MSFPRVSKRRGHRSKDDVLRYEAHRGFVIVDSSYGTESQGQFLAGIPLNPLFDRLHYCPHIQQFSL
jgi:hypothetical protein